MAELRWILLALGALFCVGLWWWETRRSHQAVASRAQPGAPERTELPLSTPAHLRALTEEAAAPAAANDELPTEPFVLAEPIPPEPAPEPEPGDMAGPLAREFERIEPILGDTEIFAQDAPFIETVTEVVEPEPAPEPPAPPPPPPPVEKIITLRLAAPPLERFEGNALVQALMAVGLTHGKFSIFHRHIAGSDAPLFSAASLVEPGTFDLDNIEGKRFPGISLFAILPGPLEAAAVLQEMVATGRQLAERLHGVLQDERGAALTLQRLADLRAEVAVWQQRVAASVAGSA